MKRKFKLANGVVVEKASNQGISDNWVKVVSTPSGVNFVSTNDFVCVAHEQHNAPVLELKGGAYGDAYDVIEELTD